METEESVDFLQKRSCRTLQRTPTYEIVLIVRYFSSPFLLQSHNSNKNSSLSTSGQILASSINNLLWGCRMQNIDRISCYIQLKSAINIWTNQQQKSRSLSNPSCDHVNHSKKFDDCFSYSFLACFIFFRNSLLTSNNDRFFLCWLFIPYSKKKFIRIFIERDQTAAKQKITLNDVCIFLVDIRLIHW
jgi:hypothetical protein